MHTENNPQLTSIEVSQLSSATGGSWWGSAFKLAEKEGSAKRNWNINSSKPPFGMCLRHSSLTPTRKGGKSFNRHHSILTLTKK